MEAIDKLGTIQLIHPPLQRAAAFIVPPIHIAICHVAHARALLADEPALSNRRGCEAFRKRPDRQRALNRVRDKLWRGRGDVAIEILRTLVIPPHLEIESMPEFLLSLRRYGVLRGRSIC
jgi:hypothetical protein